MRKTWLHYAKWSKRPKFKPAWSIKTPRKRSPVECNFDHVSHSGLFLGKSLCYWDILWTTLEHYIDGTMVHELDTANNYFCIYEKIKFACFFLAHPVLAYLEDTCELLSSSFGRLSLISSFFVSVMSAWWDHLFLLMSLSSQSKRYFKAVACSFYRS